MDNRVFDKIMEPGNAELLTKFIIGASRDDEAVKIAALGTTYCRTGGISIARGRCFAASERRSCTLKKYWRRNNTSMK